MRDRLAGHVPHDVHVAGVADLPHLPRFLQAPTGLHSSAWILVVDEVNELTKRIESRLEIAAGPLSNVVLVDFVDNPGVNGLRKGRALRLLCVWSDGRTVKLLARSVRSYSDRSIGLRWIRSVGTQESWPVDGRDLKIGMATVGTIDGAGGVDSPTDWPSITR